MWSFLKGGQSLERWSQITTYNPANILMNNVCVCGEGGGGGVVLAM